MGAGPCTGFVFLVYINAELLTAMITGNLHFDMVDIRPYLLGFLVFSIQASVQPTALSTVPVLSFELDAPYEVLAVIAPLHPRRGELCGGSGSPSFSHRTYSPTLE